MTVVISGANGFLGRHLINASLAAGFKTVGLVRRASLIDSFQPDPLLKVCVIDYDSLAESLKPIIQEHKVDIFIHNAASTISLNPSSYYKVNTELTGKIIDFLQENDKFKEDGQFIFVSSYTAAGPSNHRGPVSHYGKSKLAAETLIASSKVNYLIVRPTGVYGPGDKAFLSLFKASKRGYYLYTGSKDQKITLVHVEDLARTIIENRTQSGILHINDGHIYSHEDIRTTLSQLHGRKVMLIRVPSVVASIGLQFLNIIHRLTKTSPTLTPEKAFEITQNWDLQTIPKLKHVDFTPTYLLKEGFTNTLAHYIKTGLI